MERSAWPKNLSSSRKRAIQEVCGQNPTKLRDAFDAHSQTGDHPRHPLFAEDLIDSVLGSFSNTQSLSSGSESYEVLQVPSNACVMSEDSEESESVKIPVQRSPVESVESCVMSEDSEESESVKIPVQRSPAESVKSCVISDDSKESESFKIPIQRSPVESVKTPVRRLQRSRLAWVMDHVRRLQRSPVARVKTPVTPSWILKRSLVARVKTPATPSWILQRSPGSILLEQSLVEAATAIFKGRVDVASEILRRLSAVPKRMGYSEQKLMEYMLSALKSRVSPVDYPHPVAELFTEEHLSSFQSLYGLSPCFKLGCMAANLAIVEAASEQPSTNKLHVIDFDIGWEGRYLNPLILLYAASVHQAGNQSTLKITMVADSFNGEKRLRMIGDRVSELAAQVKVRLAFNIVRQKLSELGRKSLGCEPDEVLAVILAYKLHRMPDKSVSVENPRDELLRRVKGLAPLVVTLVEQEMNGNTAPFPMCMGEALAYYRALLESFESEFLEDGSERGRAEEGLSRKLGNWVACKGRDRVERCKVFGEWRARMGMSGFELKPLGRHLAAMKALLHCWPSPWDPRFTVKEENGGFCFGWRGRTLTVASAWH